MVGQLNSTSTADVVVIGAGLVGAAIGYGLASRKQRVLVVDGGDRDFRASNANGGLVWQQGKGLNMPAYQRLTRASVAQWGDFCAELSELIGTDLQLEQNGGLWLSTDHEELEQRRALLTTWHEQHDGPERDWDILDRAEVSKLLPGVALGPQVIGASFGHRDGQVNPLRLLSALHAGLLRRGGALQTGVPVRSLQRDADGTFTVDFGTERARAPRIVIAAGLGSKDLAAQVGLEIPIRPQRGQMLVTERLDSFLPLPLLGISQTQQGSVLIGTTNEEVGYDTSTTGTAATALCAMAQRWMPALGAAKIIRHWSGLRIMTPDGHPIYAESQSHPGAFVAVCHSGVTLAAGHANILADAVLAGKLPSSLADLHHRRFDVPKAA